MRDLGCFAGGVLHSWRGGGVHAAQGHSRRHRRSRGPQPALLPRSRRRHQSARCLLRYHASRWTHVPRAQSLRDRPGGEQCARAVRVRVELPRRLAGGRARAAAAGAAEERARRVCGGLQPRRKLADGRDDGQRAHSVRVRLARAARGRAGAWLRWRASAGARTCSPLVSSVCSSACSYCAMCLSSECCLLWPYTGRRCVHISCGLQNATDSGSAKGRKRARRCME